MQYLNNFLRKNPKLLSTYVYVATTVVDKTLTPLNSLMRHVLVIQGIDPNANPGDKYKRSLQEAIDHVEDKEDFDSDYDASWVHKQLMKTREKMSSLNLTKETFRKLTSLDNYGFDTSNADELHVVTSKEPYLFDHEGNLNSGRLGEALRVLKKYAEDLEAENVTTAPAKKVKKSVSKARQPTSVGKTKTSKKNKKVATKFKGVFRRTED